MVGELLQSIEDRVKKLTLVPGSGGVFEWKVDGKLVFSKQAEGRYPELGELKEAVFAELE